jgi:phosphate transport system substrate-binding protein
VAGCGGDEPTTATPSGTVEVDGSSTVFRISKAVQEAYSDAKPDVTVVVGNHGTGGGFARYLQGEIDVVDASRDAKQDEASKAQAQGLDWTRYLIAYDGITLAVNPQNTFVQSLTVDQLKAIWAPGSTVKTWKDVNPDWPDRKIVLYSPDNDSGTFEFFTEAIVGKAKSQRGDVQQSADDNILVNGVAGDQDGLGYFGLAYYVANKSKLRAIAVQSGADAKPVMPSHDTVLDKSYKPLSRPLYIFVKNSAMRRPEVAEFVKFYLANAAKYSEKAGYVAPTADDIAANDRALAPVASGPGSVPGAATPAATNPAGK